MILGVIYGPSRIEDEVDHQWKKSQMGIRLSPVNLVTSTRKFKRLKTNGVRLEWHLLKLIGVAFFLTSAVASALGFISRGNGFGLRFTARGSIRPGRFPTCRWAIRTNNNSSRVPISADAPCWFQAQSGFYVSEINFDLPAFFIEGLQLRF